MSNPHNDSADTVHETIAVIDNRSLQLRLEAAQLQQQKLASDYKRYQVLLQGEATTEVNVNEIRFNLETANNQIAQIRKQMADNTRTTSRPPHDQTTERRDTPA